MQVFMVILLLLIFCQEMRGLATADTRVGDPDSQDNAAVPSIFNPLMNGTSNRNVILTNNNVLSSVVVFRGLENIMITGHLNPTINCNSIGGVKFVSSKNVTIEGINWERCGSNDGSSPGVGFYNSSDIVIHNCTFHHSTGQAVVLSEVSGSVYITNSIFVHNNDFRGNGAAIHYSSVSKNRNQIVLVIGDCNFSSNGVAESVIYLYGTLNYQSNDLLLVQECVFTRNKGVPIYVTHNSVHLKGNVIFQHNEAGTGGGIHSLNSNIIFGGALFSERSRYGDTFNVASNDDMSVTFENNSAASGGAIYGQHSKITFNMSTIKFLQNSATIREGGAVFGQFSSITFNASIVFYQNSATTNGGAIYGVNFNITFNGASTVFDSNTAARDGGAVYLANSILRHAGNMLVVFHKNQATESGGAIFWVYYSTVTFDVSDRSIIFVDNKAPIGGAVYGVGSTITFGGNASMQFHGNNGGVMYGSSCMCTFDGSNNSISFSENTATSGGVFNGFRSSFIFSGENTTIVFIDNTATSGGVGYGIASTIFTFTGSTSVTFQTNRAEKEGGAFFMADSAAIRFYENAKVKFTGNHASDGGALYTVRSGVALSGNSVVMFTSNSALETGGAIYSRMNSAITCGQNTSAHFIGNRAVEGGAIQSLYISVTFWGTATFSGNMATYGGAIHSVWTNVEFYGDSNVMFIDNNSTEGGAVHIESPGGRISFDANSNVIFKNNSGIEGGALHCENSASILFTQSTSVTFNTNIAETGAAVYSRGQCYVTFGSNSIVAFTNNKAGLNGGAIASFSNSDVSFVGHSRVSFNDNIAGQDGAAIYSIIHSSITFSGESSVTMESNIAMQHGGALYSFSGGVTTIKGNSLVRFNNNTAVERGGAVYLIRQSAMYFRGNSMVMFTNNKADLNGGAMGSLYECTITFEENCTLQFHNNRCRFSGGAIYLFQNTNTSFTGSSHIEFLNNTSTNGGAMYSYDYCNTTIKEHSNVTFAKNKAQLDGGGIYCDSNCDISMTGNGLTAFSNNTARNGGAVSIIQSSITFAEHSSTHFYSNRAKENGGAIHLNNNFTLSFDDNSSIAYFYNFADQFGGAVFGDLLENTDSLIAVNTVHTSFSNNTASTGNDIYIDIPTSCDEECFNNVIVGGDNDTLQHSQFTEHINTPPSKLELNDPAVCIDHNDTRNCQTYLIQNVMLGQEIVIDACVLNRFDRSSNATQFVVNGGNQQHQIRDGPNVVLISCDTFRGIRIIGNEVSSASNFSMTITSLDGSQSESTVVSIELITELSLCHPGFHHVAASQSCECYNETDIVLCSDDSTSTIKSGYWFGEVNGKSTVSVCPNNYCDFSCCETANGYYQLSPERQNQCNSHRSGMACGGCEEDYTLSFDSVKCVRVAECTAGQTILVVSLTMIYWAVIVVLVIATTYHHYKESKEEVKINPNNKNKKNKCVHYSDGLGYLYAITYYYSVLDIILGQNLYLSQGVFTTVSIMSSIAKITPQFLGQLCLAQGISGIDQEFIHYVHPLAVTIIVVMLCLLAQISRRFSNFVSNGIIHVICFLLLLSYTSVATTSLLLMRSLTFRNVDKVYTYLSPDLEYFHGRHLFYIIIAVLCAIIIVVGLPLVLLLKPLLSHIFNFTKVQPLMDHFQGCYKDKYHSFAAYYMICRMVIIVIVVANPSNYFTTQYLLITASTILALIHLVVRPYKRNILNIFDGFVLQIMSLVALTPIIDNVTEDLLLSSTFILTFLPSVAFVVMEVFIYKEKKMTKDRHGRFSSNTGMVMSNRGTQNRYSKSCNMYRMRE